MSAFEDMRYMRNGLNMGESDEIIRVAGAFYRVCFFFVCLFERHVCDVFMCIYIHFIMFLHL